jgi:hypothetical protein
MSWMLAWHFASSDPNRSGEMALQFAELLAAETNRERISHRHRDLLLGSLHVISAAAATLGHEAAKRLVEVLVDRDGLTSAVQSRAARILAEAHQNGVKG